MTFKACAATYILVFGKGTFEYVHESVRERERERERERDRERGRERERERDIIITCTCTITYGTVYIISGGSRGVQGRASPPLGQVH